MTVLVASMVTVQLETPGGQPVMPVHIRVVRDAVRSTLVPGAYSSLQSVGQMIPGGEDPTPPGVPVPPMITVSV